MNSMRILGWVSILIAFSILGMGGAPIAEKFEMLILVIFLKWLSYISLGFLFIATIIVGGLGLYHGILTILGKEVKTFTKKDTPKLLSNNPKVEILDVDTQ